MSWLSRVIKKAKKPLVKLARTALNTVTGGLSEKAITVAKGVGSAVHHHKIANKAAQVRIEPISVRAVIARNEVPSGRPIRLKKATTMPGGAPLSRSLKRSSKKPKKARLLMTDEDLEAAYLRRRSGRSKPKSSSGKSGAKSKKPQKKKPVKGRRKAPTGGLDLKALSASWKAAGKPGTWQGWIQANK